MKGKCFEFKRESALQRRGRVLLCSIQDGMTDQGIKGKERCMKDLGPVQVLAKLTELTQDPSSRDLVTLALGTQWEQNVGVENVCGKTEISDS